MALSAQQVEQYQHDGYVCPVPVMPAAEAAGLRRQLEAVEARQGGKLEVVQRSRAYLLFKWLDGAHPFTFPTSRSRGLYAHVCLNLR
jgi:hypothetical protein